MSEKQEDTKRSVHNVTRKLPENINRKIKPHPQKEAETINQDSAIASTWDTISSELSSDSISRLKTYLDFSQTFEEFKHNLSVILKVSQAVPFFSKIDGIKKFISAAKKIEEIILAEEQSSQLYKDIYLEFDKLDQGNSDKEELIDSLNKVLAVSIDRYSDDQKIIVRFLQAIVLAWKQRSDSIKSTNLNPRTSYERNTGPTKSIEVLINSQIFSQNKDFSINIEKMYEIEAWALIEKFEDFSRSQNSIFSQEVDFTSEANYDRIFTKTTEKLLVKQKAVSKIEIPELTNLIDDFKSPIFRNPSSQFSKPIDNQHLMLNWDTPNFIEIETLLSKCFEGKSVSDNTYLAILMLVALSISPKELFQIEICSDEKIPQEPGRIIVSKKGFWHKRLITPENAIMTQPCYSPDVFSFGVIKQTLPQVINRRLKAVVEQKSLGQGLGFKSVAQLNKAVSEVCNEVSSHLTPSRLKKALFGRLIFQGVAVDNAALAIGFPERIGGQHFYYYSIKVRELQSIYDSAINDLFNSSVPNPVKEFSGENEWVGSLIHLDYPWHENKLKEYIKQKPEITIQSNLSQVILYHNWFSKYVAWLLLCSTGHRRAKKLSFTVKNISEEWVLINDKQSTLNPFRIVRLGGFVAQQLKMYRIHLKSLSMLIAKKKETHLARVLKHLTTFPNLEISESQIFFHMDENSFVIAPYTSNEIIKGIGFNNVPDNFHRHWFISGLRECGVPQEWVSSAAGHVEVGQQEWSYTALSALSSISKDWDEKRDEYLSNLGFDIIESELPSVPNRQNQTSKVEFQPFCLNPVELERKKQKDLNKILDSLILDVLKSQMENNQDLENLTKERFTVELKKRINTSNSSILNTTEKKKINKVLNIKLKDIVDDHVKIIDKDDDEKEQHKFVDFARNVVQKTEHTNLICEHTVYLSSLFEQILNEFYPAVIKTLLKQENSLHFTALQYITLVITELCLNKKELDSIFNSKSIEVHSLNDTAWIEWLYQGRQQRRLLSPLASLIFLDKNNIHNKTHNINKIHKCIESLIETYSAYKPKHQKNSSSKSSTKLDRFIECNIINGKIKFIDFLFKSANCWCTINLPNCLTSYANQEFKTSSLKFENFISTLTGEQLAKGYTEKDLEKIRDPIDILDESIVKIEKKKMTAIINKAKKYSNETTKARLAVSNELKELNKQWRILSMPSILTIVNEYAQNIFLEKNSNDSYIKQVSTICKYISSVITSFKVATKFNWNVIDEPELQNLYKNALEAYEKKNKSDPIEYAKHLRYFHNYCVVHGIHDDLDLYSISDRFTKRKLFVPKSGFIGYRHYEIARSIADKLWGKQSFQELLLILMFKFGLRVSEAIRLKREDILISDGDIIVIVISNNLGKVKTQSGNRQIRAVNLTESEREVIINHCRIFDFGKKEKLKNLSDPLFNDTFKNMKIISQSWVSRTTQEILRLVTGNRKIRLYDARHSFLSSQLYWNLNLVDRLPGSKEHWEFEGQDDHQLKLIGSCVKSRRVAFAISALAGHANFQTTYENYFHLSELVLFDYQTKMNFSEINSPELMKLTGISKQALGHLICRNKNDLELESKILQRLLKDQTPITQLNNDGNFSNDHILSLVEPCKPVFNLQLIETVISLDAKGEKLKDIELLVKLNKKVINTILQVSNELSVEINFNIKKHFLKMHFNEDRRYSKKSINLLSILEEISDKQELIDIWERGYHSMDSTLILDSEKKLKFLTKPFKKTEFKFVENYLSKEELINLSKGKNNKGYHTDNNLLFMRFVSIFKVHLDSVDNHDESMKNNRVMKYFHKAIFLFSIREKLKELINNNEVNWKN
ncbi:MAG: hypothetical protein MJK11_02000 [Pseudomonadales bacterium]|nr:hypothetical protein [Pseudomonadales bacterium]